MKYSIAENKVIEKKFFLSEIKETNKSIGCKYNNSLMYTRIFNI